MLFRGTFPYQMDDRNRVPIPPRFRKVFASEVLLVKAPDPCVQVFTEEAWNSEAEVLEKMAPYSEDGRMAIRDFYANTQDAPKDSQGRIVIPVGLREHAGIKEKGEVVVVGVKDRLEIWDRETYEASSPEFATARRAALERIAEDDARARSRAGEA